MTRKMPWTGILPVHFQPCLPRIHRSPPRGLAMATKATKARNARSSEGTLVHRRHLVAIFLALLLALFFLIFFFFPSSLSCSRVQPRPPSRFPLQPFDCLSSPQAAPVFAHKVEGVRHPFFISIADLGTPDKPNRNFQRMIKGKLFQKPEISETVQKLVGKLKVGREDVLVVDVGANVGMAAFAAAAMGARVIAFEPVYENALRFCDGVYLNRAGQLVQLFQAAVSDAEGSITLHKVIGRLDNSAVSASGAKLAFQSNKLIPFTVPSVTLDSFIDEKSEVTLLKVDVQGWEFYVLKGAVKLLSRAAERSPYLIYEEDEKLLRESNSTAQQILSFLRTVGYNFCKKIGGDRHCSKDPSIFKSV